MKKLSLSLILLLAVVTFSFSFVLAQDNITECPNVKVVIDGKTTTYDAVPIAVNGRTLLPLRTLLVNLGVQNDDSHIVWNNEEKSVTINHDGNKIYLKQGSNTAYVNDEPITLDVPAMGYEKNGRTYIPARFIAQALGKKVIWEQATTSVLIRDEKDFNSVKDILVKSNEAAKAINKVKFNADMKVNFTANGQKINSNAVCAGELDKSKNVMHMTASMDVLGQSMSFDYYFLNNAIYLKMPTQNAWQKIDMPKETLDKIFASNYSSNLEATDVLCAGLQVENGSNPEELILKGNVYLDQLMQSMNSLGNSAINLQGIQFNKYYIEMTINKKTNLITRMDADIVMSVKAGDVQQEISQKINATYDYSANFEISVPEEIK